MDFSALALLATVHIYSIDKTAKPHETVSIKPEGCVYLHVIRASNPVDAVSPCLVSSTLAAFRHKPLLDYEDPEKQKFKLAGVGFSALNLCGATMTKRTAPWSDYEGKPIHEGDVIEHPESKERGRVIYLPSQGPDEVDRWRVRYSNDDMFLSRLCLQIGDRGRAVVVSD